MFVHRLTLLQVTKKFCIYLQNCLNVSENGIYGFGTDLGHFFRLGRDDGWAGFAYETMDLGAPVVTTDFK